MFCAYNPAFYGGFFGRYPLVFGAEEFPQDSPRYASPKGSGLYPESSYFMDGAGGGDWGAGVGGPSSYGSYNPSSVMPSHLSQSYPPNSGPGGSTMHLPPSHDPMGYSHPGIPSNNDSPLIASSLPPMSTFRANPGGPGGGGGPQGVPPSSGVVNNTTSPLYNNHSPVIVPPPPPGQTGDTVGKALASIYTTDHSASSSSPCTPVNSPPPLTSSGQQWGGSSGGVTPFTPANHPPTSPGFGDRALHMVCPTLNHQPVPEQQSLDDAIGILRDHAEGSRMEERLDDAINVLRNHAESPHPSFHPGLTSVPSHLAAPPHSNGLLGYPPPLESHLSPHGNCSTVGGTPQAYGPIPTHSTNNPDMGSDSVKLERANPTPTPHKSKKRKDADLDVKSDLIGLGSNNSSASTTSSTSSIGHKGAKRSRRSSGDDDGDDNPLNKLQREKERRQANNARERIRIRDINEALKELGRMCMQHLKSDKPQTKLGILNMAVEVIMQLEQQVRERNLNPKAACLKRREEEKAEDGPKIPGHPLGPPPHLGPPFPSMAVSVNPNAAHTHPHTHIPAQGQ
ncbi:unnamed protein product [Allacma fusca]|uniref:BHLH domain-containing protein n=1 Tax=Allacma fusca TaxID=39272 RepID=A0A8J2KW65_9HEXA|nr:unnamed protein product [Allacma fusca]